MLNFSPMQKSSRPIKSRRQLAAGLRLSSCLIFVMACAAGGQTLARPGWTASGFTADPWWKHAVFYQMARTTFRRPGAPAAASHPPDWMSDANSISDKLDALQALRIDALILPMPQEQNSAATLDAFDDMVSQASRRGIRVVLALPAAGSNQTLSYRARFWLSRGIAGIYVFTPAQSSSANTQAVVRMIRTIASTAVGGRIVISDLAAEAVTDQPAARVPSRRRKRHSSVAPFSGTVDQASGQLQIDSHLDLPQLPDAATLRGMIASEPQGSNVLLGLQPPANPETTTDPYLAISKSIAAIELTTHPVALLDADGALSSEVGTGESAASDWYRQLIALHHGNSTLRYGTATPLDFDAQNALVWVSRAPQGTAQMLPVVVTCNLTSLPLHVSLGAAIRGLGLRGSFLRTLLRTDVSMGPQDLDNVTIPPFGVYIGELRR
jgi:hypothetical protein